MIPSLEKADAFLAGEWESDRWLALPEKQREQALSSAAKRVAALPLCPDTPEDVLAQAVALEALMLVDPDYISGQRARRRGLSSLQAKNAAERFVSSDPLLANPLALALLTPFRVKQVPIHV